MKYIKALSAVWVSVLIAVSLTACQKGGSVINEAWNAQVDTSNTGYMTSKDDFESVIGTMVDLSLYEEIDISENSNYSRYSYTMDYANWTGYNLDYKVELGDGTEFTLPISLPELEKKGWTIQETMEPDKELRAGYARFGVCENVEGKILELVAANKTDKDQAFRECTVTEVEFEVAIGDKPVTTMPGFRVCGKLTQTSNLQEIISCLGDPTYIGYTIWQEEDKSYVYSTMTIQYLQPDDKDGKLCFTLSMDGNYILSMEYAA